MDFSKPMIIGIEIDREDKNDKIVISFDDGGKTQLDLNAKDRGISIFCSSDFGLARDRGCFATKNGQRTKRIK